MACMQTKVNQGDRLMRLMQIAYLEPFFKTLNCLIEYLELGGLSQLSVLWPCHMHGSGSPQIFIKTSEHQKRSVHGIGGAGVAPFNFSARPCTFFSPPSPAQGLSIGWQNALSHARAFAWALCIWDHARAMFAR